MKQCKFADELLKSLRINKDSLHIVTVYKNPIDHINHYVARLSLQKGGVINNTDIMVKTLKFESISELLPPDTFHWIDRYPHDEAHIMGTWI